MKILIKSKGVFVRAKISSDSTLAEVFEVIRGLLSSIGYDEDSINKHIEAIKKLNQ